MEPARLRSVANSSVKSDAQAIEVVQHGKNTRFRDQAIHDPRRKLRMSPHTGLLTPRSVAPGVRRVCADSRK